MATHGRSAAAVIGVEPDRGVVIIRPNVGGKKPMLHVIAAIVAFGLAKLYTTPARCWGHR
jgi:hypothetical protein